MGFKLDIDSNIYIAMADGRWSEVVRPFSNRVLGPVLAHWVGFPAVQVFAVVLFAASVAYLLRKSGTSPLKALPFLLAPWLAGFVLNLYMPDMLANALTAALFAVYAWRGPFAAAPLLVPMMMARESSVVVAVAWVGMVMVEKVEKVERVERVERVNNSAVRLGFLTRTNLLLISLIILCTVIGLGLARAISAESQGTLTGMGLSYLPAKAVVSALYSFAGVKPWNDVYAAQLPEFYTHAPLWKMVCPEILRLGRFAEIGIYEWHPEQILTTARIMLLGFGVVIPAVGLRGLRRLRGLRGLEGLMVVTGLAFWLLTPFCSFSPHRYIGYAWPLWWMWAVPKIVAEPARKYWLWLAVHVIVLGVALL